MDNMEQFLQWVKESDNIVFFGGAGVGWGGGDCCRLIPDL